MPGLIPPGTWKVMTSILGKKFVEILDEFHLAIKGGRPGEIGIVADDVHLHRQRSRGDGATDSPHPDDTQCFALKLRPLVTLRFFQSRGPGLQAGMRLRNFPRQGEHQRQRVLGRGKRAGLGGVENQNSLGGGGRQIDVIDTHARPRDRFQLSGILQNLGVTFAPERTISASYSPTIAASSSSFRPTFASKSACSA